MSGGAFRPGAADPGTPGSGGALPEVTLAHFIGQAVMQGLVSASPRSA